VTARLPFRTRLMLTWVAALVCALAIFAGIAYGVVRVTIGRAFVARLQTAVTAIDAIVERKNGTIAMEASDRAQFASILGTGMSGAVSDAFGTVIVDNVERVPSHVLALVRESKGPATKVVAVGSGAKAEAAVAPILDAGRRVGTIAVWESRDAYEDFLRIFLLALVGIGLFLTVVGVAIAGLLAKRAMSPLTELAGLVSEIESYDLSERLQWRGADDELGRLCASFDRLLERLEAAFERQRRFVADASHDLRGPLAVIRAETELALKKPRESDEYRRALRTIGLEVDDLTRLVDALLLAARVEAQPAPRVAIDLGDLAKSAAVRIEPLARQRNVSVRVDVAAGHTIYGDRAQLESALIALLDNATRHTRANGVVHLLVRRVDGEVRLTVRDDGAGFSQDALRYATDRFWRGDSAREGPGSGLGLAIVKGAVERFGGRVELANAEDGGAKVTLRFG